MRAIYAIAHHQPCAHNAVVKQLVHLLTRNAQCEGTCYTDHIIPGVFQPEGLPTGLERQRAYPADSIHPVILCLFVVAPNTGCIFWAVMNTNSSMGFFLVCW